VHESCINNGASKVTTNIKVYEAAQKADADTIEGRKNKVKP